MTKQTDSSGVRLFPPVIPVGAIALAFLFQWVAPVRIAGSDRRLTLLIGSLLLAAAVGLIAWTAAIMFRSGTTPNPTRPTAALVFRGPFRVTRNPMYLALEFLCIGVGLVANTLWPIVIALPAAFALRRLVIDKEERYLERKFGPEYLDYKARVRRWL